MPDAEYSEKTYLIDLLVAHDGDYGAAALSAGLSAEGFRRRVGKHPDIVERFGDNDAPPTDIESYLRPADTRVSKIRPAKTEDFADGLAAIGMNPEVVAKAVALNNLGKKHLVAMMNVTNASGFDAHQKLVGEMGKIQERLGEVRALLREGVMRDPESGVLIERDAEARNFLSMEEDRLLRQLNEIAKRGADVMRINYTFAAMMSRSRVTKAPKAGYGRSED